jgi:hypothetical protein
VADRRVGARANGGRRRPGDGDARGMRSSGARGGARGEGWGSGSGAALGAGAGAAAPVGLGHGRDGALGRRSGGGWFE